MDKGRLYDNDGESMIEFWLHPRAEMALLYLHAELEMSNVDVVNRAIQLWSVLFAEHMRVNTGPVAVVRKVARKRLEVVKDFTVVAELEEGMYTHHSGYGLTERTVSILRALRALDVSYSAVVNQALICYRNQREEIAAGNMVATRDVLGAFEPVSATDEKPREP